MQCFVLYSVSSTGLLFHSISIFSPEGHNPDISEDQSKWPLQPGLLIHINKMNNVSISQLGPRTTPYKTTSVKKLRVFSKYKRNKSKVYARLERLKVFLGIKANSTAVPKGIVMSPGGGKVLLFYSFLCHFIIFVFVAC